MKNIVTAELLCLMIILIILMGVWFQRIIGDRRSRYFMYILFICLLGLVSDILSYVINYLPEPNLFDYVINSMSFAVGSLMMIPFGFYVHSVAKRQNPFSIKVVYVVSAILVLHFCYLFALGMSGNLFDTTPECFGQGEFPIWSSIFIMLAMLFYPVVAIIRSRYYGFTSILAIISYVIFPLFFELIAAVTGTVESYTYAGGALSMLFIYILLQNNLMADAVAEQKLALKLASMDALTGIGNRYVGADVINQHIRNRTPFTMMVLDVDKFKYINDTFGHPVGDQVLKNVANILRIDFPDAVPIRMGGDEFMVIVDGCLGEGELQARISVMFDDIRGIQVSGMSESHIVNVSVGLAFYDGVQNCSFEELYHISDQRLYVSKKHIT